MIRTNKGRVLVAFDVDGTLLNADESPREEIITLLKGLSPFTKTLVWSGSGKDWAELTVRRLDLTDYVDFIDTKLNHQAYKVDLAFDDIKDFNLAEKVINV